jgi:hypothetical protein
MSSANQGFVAVAASSRQLYAPPSSLFSYVEYVVQQKYSFRAWVEPLEFLVLVRSLLCGGRARVVFLSCI